MRGKHADLACRPERKAGRWCRLEFEWKYAGSWRNEGKQGMQASEGIRQPGWHEREDIGRQVGRLS